MGERVAFCPMLIELNDIRRVAEGQIGETLCILSSVEEL